jgi:hypothetical protein
MSASDAEWNTAELSRLLEKARNYTLGLIADVRNEDWYRIPQGLPSHIAWHVGHLAVVEYRLVVERVRGRRDEDESVLPAAFVPRFGKGSIPQPTDDGRASVGQLQEVLQKVHQLALSELSSYTKEQLAAPSEPPHPMFSTCGEAVQWCAMHEMLHAGHIACLRRALGYPSLR